MVASPEICATFSVTSGCLCFGALHNIWHASSVSVQSFPQIRPHPSGTVKVHTIDCNTSAQNGTWNAFQLIDLQTKEVAAWFLAHSDVDPQVEIDKILRVSGSPYEEDSGSNMNDEKTAAEGVFVINRYDWGYHNKRSWNEIGEGVEDDEDYLASSNSIGVVDMVEARNQLLLWKDQPASKREWSKHGGWLHIPHGECMYGRFGFDEQHLSARSFLFFSVGTTFTRTTFAGLQKTLRKYESAEERFERRLREGFSFSGLPVIHHLQKSRPPTSECLGPYDKREHILREQDIDALYDHLPFQVPAFAPFAESWREPSFDLLNEIVLSYLERTALPCMGNRSVLSAAAVLFPQHSQTNGLDHEYFRYFKQAHTDPIIDFDATYMSGRIRTFLTSRSEGSSAVVSDESIGGICRVIAHLLAEVFELANNVALDSGRAKITPADFRLAVINNYDWGNLLLFSKVFWEGRNPSLPLDVTRSAV